MFGCLIHRFGHKARRADDRLNPTTGIRSHAARAHHRARARRRARLADQGATGGVSLAVHHSRSLATAVANLAARSLKCREAYVWTFARALEHRILFERRECTATLPSDCVEEWSPRTDSRARPNDGCAVTGTAPRLLEAPHVLEAPCVRRRSCVPWLRRAARSVAAPRRASSYVCLVSAPQSERASGEVRVRARTICCG